jgi:hypothetical protein
VPVFKTHICLAVRGNIYLGILPNFYGENCVFVIGKKPELTANRQEALFTAVYIGAVIISLAVIYVSYLPQSLWNSIVDFFMTLTLSPVPSASIALPAPANPAAHTSLYLAGFQFAIAIGIIEIIVLFLRILFHSSIQRKAETIENIVFWLGASYLITTYLMNMTIVAEWFVFWAGLILIFGLALVARAFVLLSSRR